MNEKITAAVINILLFISTFRLSLQPLSSNYTAQVNKRKKGEKFSHEKLNPQPQTRDVTTRERENRGGESDEERDKRDKQFDGKRDREKGKQVHVETHTRGTRWNFSGLDEERRTKDGHEHPGRMIRHRRFTGYCGENRHFSIEFDGWNPRHNFHASFSWEIIDNTGISCGAFDLGSENSTCLDGDECSFAFGSMLT